MDLKRTIMNGVASGFCSLALGLPATSAVTADRFGALYYPGETAVFTTDQAGDWQVADWRDALCAKGTVADGVVSVSHDGIGRRYGAFKLTIGTNETWFAFLRTRRVNPCGWVGVGTHSSHGWHRRDYRYLDLMSAAGIGMVRDDVIWAWYEKERGVYDFDARLRGLIDELCKRGIRFHPVLNGRNDLYPNPLDPDAYANFAAAFVKEFKGKVRSCDIFNEPHNFDFPHVYLPEGEAFKKWQCHPDAPWIPKHAEATRKAVAAIKAVDPDFSPGVGVEDFWEFFKIMLKGDLVRADDLVSIHPYDHERHPPEGNWLFKDNGREVREYLLAHGGATRLAITECGWTTYEPDRDATHAFVGGYPPSSLVQQAQYLVRFWILSRQLGIEFACQYDFMDDGPKRNYTEHNFGLVRQDYTPKPSFSALATMTRLVGEAAPKGSFSTDEARYRLYRFEKGGMIIFAAWALRDETDVAWPIDGGVQATEAIDLQGNSIPPPIRDGRLVLSEAPIYLIGR
ncbi:MAG: hypothetical protein ACOX9C_08740 [Kiritimatiellia bacterium]